MTLSLAPFFARKLLFVTGKGGIGKTLVASALGLAAAKAGKRVLLVECSARDQISPLFGISAIGHHETVLSKNLCGINLSPPETFEEYVVKYLGQKRLFDHVFTNKVVRSFISTVPGFAEVMLLGRLFYTCELAPGPRHDLVIFDGYASGHFMSLMTTPDAVLTSNLGGPLAKETGRVRAFMADRDKCGVVYIGVPEELVVSECLDFLPRLSAKSPAKLMALFMNRVPELVPPGKGAAFEFAARASDRARSALGTLTTGLGKLARDGLSLPVYSLPDLGFVSEPLGPSFDDELFTSAASIVS